MKKILSFIFISVLVSGCASQKSIDDELLNIDGLTLKQDDSGQSFIEKYTLNKPYGSKLADIKMCLSRSIENKNVTLIDSSGSFITDFSQFYGSIINSNSAQGYEVIVAESKDIIVAAGIGEYYTDQLIPNLRYVRYILSVSPNKTSTSYTFTQIEQAAKNTGAFTNKGFSKVGAWPSDYPVKVIGMLDNEVKKVTQCLQKN